MAESAQLCDSAVCRLCGEENKHGISLYQTTAEDEQNLSELINKYLPLKVSEEGKFPKTICPGCNIQLDATVQFFDLIVHGQSRLRDLWKQQQDRARRRQKEAADEPTYAPITIQAFEENGNEIVLQLLPDGSLYNPSSEIALKMDGRDRPRRKRGRPPKLPLEALAELEMARADDDAASSAAATAGTASAAAAKLAEDEPDELDADGRRRRRRKIPLRFQEAVQGKELEKMFREEGVIGEEDSDLEEKLSGGERGIVGGGTTSDPKDDAIGHLESTDGQDLGQLVFVNRTKGSSSHGGGGGGGGSSTAGKRLRARKRKKFACDVCGRIFQHYGRYLMHRNFHKDVRYQCDDCKQTFDSKELMAQHQLETAHSGEGIIEGGVEGEELAADGAVATEDGTVGEGAVPDGKFHCVECEKAFGTKQSLDVHRKAVHEGRKPFACSKCDKTFSYATSLKGHMAWHDHHKSGKGYACEICKKVFNHPSSVIYHKEAEHNNGRRFVCNKCGKTFKHKQLLQRHQLVHSDSRPFPCKQCRATFKTKANLLNHQSVHTGVKKYFCQLCQQQFAHKTSLTLHYRWHNGQRPYECPVCNKSFSQKGNLEEHKRIHTGEKPYACDFCGRKFTTSSQYKLHVKRHTGERPWRCEYCDKTFLHKDTWKCHTRRHRNERPFKCDACPRGFTEQWALRKHQRLHTGEKPYTCEVCAKSFSDCSNLTKHRRIHATKETAAAVPPADTDATTATVAGSKMYYVTYQDPDSFVHIIDEMQSFDGETGAVELTSAMLAEDEEETAALATIDTLEAGGDITFPTSHLQVIDEDGNPVYFTSLDGQALKVTTVDGEHLQVVLQDGSVVPIQPNAKVGTVRAFCDDALLQEKEAELEGAAVFSEQVAVGETEKDTLDAQLPSIELMAPDGQNVCLVTSYNIDSDPMSFLR